jgi:predicted RNA-binding Zn-ribbon protein involved in translation (DUF1610 family)
MAVQTSGYRYLIVTRIVKEEDGKVIDDRITRFAKNSADVIKTMSTMTKKEQVCTRVIDTRLVDYCPQCKRLVVGEWANDRDETVLICPDCGSEVDYDIEEG